MVVRWLCGDWLTGVDYCPYARHTRSDLSPSVGGLVPVAFRHGLGEPPHEWFARGTKNGKADKEVPRRTNLLCVVGERRDGQRPDRDHVEGDD